MYSRNIMRWLSNKTVKCQIGSIISDWIFLFVDQLKIHICLVVIVAPKSIGTKLIICFYFDMLPFSFGSPLNVEAIRRFNHIPKYLSCFRRFVVINWKDWTDKTEFLKLQVHWTLKSHFLYMNRSCVWLFSVAFFFVLFVFCLPFKMVSMFQNGLQRRSNMQNLQQTAFD